MSTDIKMVPEVARQWVDALRSGEYKQTTGFLRRRTADGEGFCCLGVLCEVAVKNGVIPPVDPPMGGSNAYVYQDADAESECGSLFMPPATVLAWAFGDQEIGDNPDKAWTVTDTDNEWDDDGWGNDLVGLTNLNDSHGVGFDRIADLVEREHLTGAPA